MKYLIILALFLSSCTKLSTTNTVSELHKFIIENPNISNDLIVQIQDTLDVHLVKQFEHIYKVGDTFAVQCNFKSDTCTLYGIGYGLYNRIGKQVKFYINK